MSINSLILNKFVINSYKIVVLRNKSVYNKEDIAAFKCKLLVWSQQFDDVVWLDSNNYTQQYSSYDAVLAVDAFTAIQTDYQEAFNTLDEYQKSTKDWIFGYLTYDLKNDTEALQSRNFDGLGFPDLYFFQPKKLFLIKGNTVETQYLKAVEDELEKDLLAIEDQKENPTTSETSTLKMKQRIPEKAYYDKLNTLLTHIHRGDIYEANFCQEFYAENATINPLETYLKLNAISKPPFATFLKSGDKFLLSATPERYLKKEGTKIISQPIKGTSKREQDSTKDEALKNALGSDEKERSENIMIVDLVRNDLSHTARRGSVKVEELCKIYSFEQVHQMISTVVSEVEETTSPIKILQTTFPMGSMTGVPKISALTIIEKLEETKRGLYSGAVGYITPDGDFDFNVVIRSILYNTTKKYVSYSVGGAITAKSNPQKEYEECGIKAKAMRDVLEN
ncbi:anthranilate synthase component I family protein [Bizionia saleffrena]|uniref:Anthranilate synthase component I family protein n=1 Tax=Bizionia saleffrena TaxID=291189 RepID=A0A8H2LE36_9FLAO|nr:anthranilate synthase component I family protein [Bizionia saleffrena]TYB73058.1 anthranilate synthase component I family protein [Bizionia saleffrena]